MPAFFFSPFSFFDERRRDQDSFFSPLPFPEWIAEDSPSPFSLSREVRSCGMPNSVGPFFLPSVPEKVDISAFSFSLFLFPGVLSLQLTDSATPPWALLFFSFLSLGEAPLRPSSFPLFFCG